MDTPSLGNVDLSSQISVAVAKKTLDSQRAEGDAAVALIRGAVDLQKSSPGAVSGVNQSAGGGLDTYA